MSAYEEVRERDRGFCLLCLLSGQRIQGTEVHHIIPRGRCRGKWGYLREDVRNLALLCHAHHQPSPSREEARDLLLYLRERYHYAYKEVPFLQVLEEMAYG